MHRVTIDKTILNSLEKLSPVDKLKLVDFLLLSIDKPNPKIEKAWEEEAENRLKAYERSEIKSGQYKVFMKRFSNN
ncbi:MAG: addiction module protein [Ignavibacteria bacterium]|nr:addiction module protein [Ignavibacteria bacterium]